MNSNTQSVPRMRILGLLALSVGACASALVAYTAISNLGWTPLNLPHAGRVGLIAPEAWKFFTKDPHSELFVALERSDGRWQSPYPTQNGSAAYAFGANREGRGHGVEVGLLMAEVKEKEWRACEGDPASCLEGAASIAVDNKSPHPALCGEVGLVLAPPIPWQWAHNKKTVFMPSRVAKLVVQC